MSPRKLHRPAFTLLEVLLAMALTALVLVVIAMALDLHLRAVDAGRVEVEQAQLARAILHRMADDIRGAVPYDPLKSDQTMQLAVTADQLTKAMAGSGTSGASGSSGSGTSGSSGSGTSGSGGSGSSGSGGSGAGTPSGSAGTGAGGGSSGTGGTGQASSGSSSSGLSGLSSLSGSGASATGTDATTDPNAGVCPRALPGLYGTADVLQMDVSRLPRLDQLSSDVTQSPGSGTLDRVSDLKTVTYYVIPPNSGQLATSPQGTTVRTGLVRRELDRAVTAHAAEMGTLDLMDAEVEPLAPEVVAVEFAYFDGLEWLDYWDSQELGGLPWAIQITLLIVPSTNPSGAALPWNDASQTTSADGQPLLQYRHMVYLPAARAAMAQSGAGSSGDTAGTGTASASGSGGTSTSGAAAGAGSGTGTSSGAGAGSGAGTSGGSSKGSSGGGTTTGSSGGSGKGSSGGGTNTGSSGGGSGKTGR